MVNYKKIFITTIIFARIVCTIMAQAPSTNAEVEAFREQGWEYVSKSDYDSAIEEFNKALQIDPNYARAYSNRGLAYVA
jgi:Tfp pilus assembly protein PilF